ncbi:vanW family protein [Clostridium sp. CAG:575]|nr:vanW family protein [Clostridium sp. CAG:575]
MSRKLFCEYGPVAYEISVRKEAILKDIDDYIIKRYKIAKKKNYENFEYLWKGEAKILFRKLHGVDMQLQYNKATNLKIAGKKIDGIVIYPGEVFSLWNLVGKTSKRKGYLEGLTINDSELGKGRGGGLCQLGNLIHYLVLHTDLEVIEKHHHSDALFPDEKRRVPFGTGTSIAYKKLDYKFKNTLDCPVQLRIWQDDKMIYGEIRGTKPISYKYRLVEEDSHFAMEDGIFYRNSKVYRIKTDKETGKDIKKELILDNHSRVMYDYDLIPKDQIRENNYVKQDYK